MGVLLLLPLSALAQETEEPKEPSVYWASKPVECSTPIEIAALMAKFGEIPAIILDGQAGMDNGMVSASKFVISINPKTETWTLLEFSGTEQACILGSGKGNISFGKRGITT